jgi:ferrous-iron efflux pump FieF
MVAMGITLRRNRTMAVASPETAAAASAQLMQRATYASLAVAALLIIAKTFAWGMTESVSVLSSLLDSLLDAVASAVNLFAVRHALTPADREHRFGHGKAEPLAGLAQAAFITGSAALLLLQAARRLHAPQPIGGSDIGIGVMVFSIVLTFALVTYQRHVVRSTGSVAIGADRLHYAGDVLLNCSVILALILSGWFGFAYADPIFGLGVGLYILISALRIGRQSLDLLMDRELPDDQRAKIRAIALGHPEVKSVHDLRTRSSGLDIFVQLHIEMDPQMTLRRAHEVSDAVEREIMAVFPNAEVMIHQDPEGIEEPRQVFPKQA